MKGNVLQLVFFGEFARIHRDDSMKGSALAALAKTDKYIRLRCCRHIIWYVFSRVLQFSKRKTKKNLQLAFLVTTFGSLELKRFLTFPSAYLVELSCEKSLQVNPEIYIYIHWLLAWRQDSWCGRNGNACAHKLWIRCAHCQSHVRCVSSCQ